MNRSTRFCRPLRNHSATWPHEGGPIQAIKGLGNWSHPDLAKVLKLNSGRISEIGEPDPFPCPAARNRNYRGFSEAARGLRPVIPRKCHSDWNLISVATARCDQPTPPNTICPDRSQVAPVNAIRGSRPISRSGAEEPHLSTMSGTTTPAGCSPELWMPAFGLQCGCFGSFR